MRFTLRLRFLRVISTASNAGEWHVVASDYGSSRPCDVPQPQGARRGEPRTPATACRPAPTIQAAAASNWRSDPLGLAVTHLGWLAILPRDRPTRNGCPLAMAVAVRRANHRIDPSRVPQSCHHLERGAASTDSAFVLRVLSSLANASVAPSELTRAARDRTARTWGSDRDPAGRRLHHRYCRAA